MHRLLIFLQPALIQFPAFVVLFKFRSVAIHVYANKAIVQLR